MARPRGMLSSTRRSPRLWPAGACRRSVRRSAWPAGSREPGCAVEVVGIVADRLTWLGRPRRPSFFRCRARRRAPSCSSCARPRRRRRRGHQSRGRCGGSRDSLGQLRDGRGARVAAGQQPAQWGVGWCVAGHGGPPLAATGLHSVLTIRFAAAPMSSAFAWPLAPTAAIVRLVLRQALGLMLEAFLAVCSSRCRSSSSSGCSPIFPPSTLSRC